MPASLFRVFLQHLASRGGWESCNWIYNHIIICYERYRTYLHTLICIYIYIYVNVYIYIYVWLCRHFALPWFASFRYQVLIYIYMWYNHNYIHNWIYTFSYGPISQFMGLESHTYTVFSHQKCAQVPWITCFLMGMSMNHLGLVNGI